MSTTTVPAVELEGVSHFHDVLRVLDEVDLRIAPNVITAVVGPSGAGKTTLLRLIAGLIAPTRGTIWLSGEAVAGERARSFIPPERRKVGIAMARAALFPHLTVASNIGYGTSRRQRPQRVAELLEAIGLGGQGRRMPHELTSGQAQCVAIARALAPKPDVVLLDEPLAPVEAQRRADVRGLIATLVERERATVVMATQDHDDALVLGDQIAVMMSGRITQVGWAEEVYRHPVTPATAAVLGPVNVLEGVVTKGLLRTVLGPFRVEAEDGEVLALVRPEDLDVEVAAAGSSQVSHVEYYGRDQLVTVVLRDGTRVRARVQGKRRLAAGARVRVKGKGLPPVVLPR